MRKYANRHIKRNEVKLSLSARRRLATTSSSTTMLRNGSYPAAVLTQEQVGHYLNAMLGLDD